MIEKYEFIQRTLYLIGEKLKERLPDKATLDEMVAEAKDAIEGIYK
jgi:hypothetical protein